MTHESVPELAAEPISGVRAPEFTLGTELGRGGMGVVYLAEDHNLGDRCAVKLMHRELMKDEALVTRFKQEAQAAAAIGHHAVVKPRKMGQLPDGVWYYMMELADCTLQQWCARRNEPIPLPTILAILGPISEALDKAHTRGIFHRDLKPENILITERDGKLYPSVTDFGLAKWTGRASLTLPGAAPGTVAFMAPEQARGDQVDRRCDIYSLGVIAYWMITGGCYPYDVPDGVLYHAQMTGSLVAPQQRCAGISDLAASAITNAIQVDPERRTKTAGALMLALARSFSGDGMYSDGTTILRNCAGGLFRVSNLAETHRVKTDALARLASQAGSYDYGTRLGEGGMAEVVRATWRGADGFVVPRAVKRILTGYEKNATFVKMFQREALVSALLNHRNIVKVHDHNYDQDGRLYLAMELVEGIDLLKLRDSGRIPYAVTIFIMSEMLEGLSYAHELPAASPLASPQELAARGTTRGVVHRDVSPHNVLISWQGDVKVTDFGIAVLRSTTAANGSLMIKGKVGYMAPEQARAAAKIDARADLWAVGVMMWELLTGHRLFDDGGNDLAAMLNAVLIAPIPSVSSRNPDVPPDLAAVTMKLLEREPSERYQTAQHVIAALNACASASRSGRAELQRLLVQRFPESAPEPAHASVAALAVSHASQRGTSASLASAHAVPGSAVRAFPWQPSSSTHTQASGEALAVPRGRTQRWPPTAALVVLGLALAAFVALVMIRPASRQPVNTVAGVPRSSDAASDITPTPRAARPSTSLTIPAPTPPAPATARSTTSSSGIAVPRPPPATTDGGGEASATPPSKEGPGRNAMVPEPMAALEKHADAAATPRHAETVSPGGGKPPGSDAPAKLPEQRGELSIIVKPWAMVTINGRSAGQTPYRRRLPIGVYRVRIVNDNAEKDETLTVTVTRDRTTNVERAWVGR